VKYANEMQIYFQLLLICFSLVVVFVGFLVDY